MPAKERAPVIGLTVEVLEPPHYEGRRRYQLFTDYLHCLRGTGALPILLPADADAAEARGWLDLLDGLLLTGGDDIDLRPLGGPPPTQECKPIPAAKQELDMYLVRCACERALPLLGVCLGMQVFGLAHQAEYVQHLDQATGHEKGISHAVRPVPGTLLAGLVGEAPFQVPSFHHQGLRNPGRGLTASAWADDGVLEAVERADLPFALGVQWHPERHPESPHARALFSGFVQAARSYRRS